MTWGLMLPPDIHLSQGRESDRDGIYSGIIGHPSGFTANKSPSNAFPKTTIYMYSK